MLYLRFLFKYAEYKISVEIKGSEVQSDEQKKIVSAMSLPDMPAETPLFVRDIRRDVGRDVAL